MLRAPIWTTSAYSAIASACWVSRNSVTTGSPVSARASARISSASRPSPLNANGDVRGLNAPPRSIEAPASRTVRATLSVCSRVSTVHGPAIRQNVSLPPTRAAVDRERRRLVVGELGGGELVRARDRHDAVDAGHPLQPELAHALGVADRADRGRQLARQHEHVHAGGGELGLDGLDLAPRRPRVSSRSSRRYSPSSRTPSSSAPRWWASSWRTVRVTCARSSSGSWPKSRSSVSRKMMIRSG